MRAAFAFQPVCIILVAAGMLLLPSLEAAPVIVLSPGTGSAGSEIAVSGSGFLPTDTTCNLSSPSSAGLMISSACVIQGGSLSGGFTVGDISAGAYVVEATGDQGDFAQTIVQIEGGAQITLSPATAAPGAGVSVQGVGFLPTDTTCTISSPSSPGLILNGACVVQSGTGTPHGGFLIGNVLPGEYVVQVDGNQGDSAQTVVTVE